MKVNFLVDHISRDLNIYSCVGRILNEGVQNTAITYDHQDFSNRWTHYDYFERTRLKSDIVLTPSYNVRRTPSLFSRALRQNSNLIVAHSEQIFSKEYYNEKFNMKFKKAYNRHVKAHIVWGKDFAIKLNKYAGVDPENIYIVGNPKLDCVHREVMTTNLSNSRETILIVSDFLVGDYNDAEWKEFKVRYNVKSDNENNKMYAKARKKCIEWVIEAAQKNKDKLFVMRKHPGEKDNEYNILEGYSNIQVSSSKPFLEDLKIADIVFMYTSTSVFEVLASGKPYYNLNLIESTLDNPKDHYCLFNWITKNEFLKLVQDNLRNSKENNFSNNNINIDNLIHDPTGNSLTKTAIAIYEISKKEGNNLKYIDYLWGYGYLIVPFIKNMIIKSSYNLKDKFHIENKLEKRFKSKFEKLMNSEDFMTEKNIDNSLQYATKMISNEDILIIKEKRYTLRREDEGIYIDI